ncbi:hypothetical protein IKN40_07955 [bacterium]|nr:hypothetical protein [bacterium]
MSDNKSQKDENKKNVSQVEESTNIDDDFLQDELNELQAAEDEAKQVAQADF